MLYFPVTTKKGIQMYLLDYTDGENTVELELGDIPSSDMDDIQDMIALRIEQMIILELRELDLPLSMGELTSVEINSLDISVQFQLNEEEEQDG